jgi:hypothetical protein
MSNGRKRFTDREWRETLEAQGGTCCVPGCPSTGPFHEEHELPNYYSPGKPSALMCVPHHKEKTRKDRKDIAKTKRLNGESKSQAARRKERKERGLPPLLRGRGFAGKPRARSAEEIRGERP